MYKHEQGIPMKIGNNRPLHGSVLAGVVGVLLLAGCQRESEPAPATDAAPAAEATAAGETPATEAPLDLRDVIENNEREVVGISYPAGIDRYPAWPARCRAMPRVRAATCSRRWTGWATTSRPCPTSCR